MLGQGWFTTEIPFPHTASHPWKPELGPVAEMFKSAWDVVIQDARMRETEWTVKVDPDTVFFPERLRQHLQRLQQPENKTVFLLNCDRYSGSPVLFGAVEVLSRRAVEAYSSGQERCRGSIPWRTLPEDEFMQKCMQLLGVTSVFDGNMVGDDRCWKAPCSDVRRVAFHSYPQASSYLICWEESNDVALSLGQPVDTVTAKKMEQL